MNLTLRDLPEHTRMKRNILAIYDAAREEHVAEGKIWYQGALETARNIAVGTPYTTEQIVGIMAIISGKLYWYHNEVYPRYIVDNYSKGIPVTEWKTPEGKGLYVTMKVREQCVAILEGEDPRVFLGQKTAAFFANILGNQDVVTVDRWAMRVAVLDEKVKSATRAASRKIGEAYMEAAMARATTPGACQATAWIAYRNGIREI